MSKTTINGIAEILQAEVAILREYTSAQRIGGYIGLSDFLLQRGRVFEPRPLPDDVRVGRAQACFKNCNQLAIDCSRFTYCEGYAAGVIPVLHAWLTDSSGYVIDPTWAGSRGRVKRPDLGWQYFGVAIRTEYLIEHLCATETHGPVLDNWSQGYPIFTAPAERWRI